MRRPNWRVVIVGLVLIVAAAAFFLGMETMAPKSNDPVEMMKTVGEAAGAACGVGLAMIIFGMIGRRK
jgi:hypothetical protein